MVVSCKKWVQADSLHLDQNQILAGFLTVAIAFAFQPNEFRLRSQRMQKDNPLYVGTLVNSNSFEISDFLKVYVLKSGISLGLLAVTLALLQP